MHLIKSNNVLHACMCMYHFKYNTWDNMANPMSSMYSVIRITIQFFKGLWYNFIKMIRPLQSGLFSCVSSPVIWFTSSVTGQVITFFQISLSFSKMENIRHVLLPHDFLAWINKIMYKLYFENVTSIGSKEILLTLVELQFSDHYFYVLLLGFSFYFSHLH